MPVLGIMAVAEVSPLPAPYEHLDWRGFRKIALQNLERLRVRGQNLDNRTVMVIL